MSQPGGNLEASRRIPMSGECLAEAKRCPVEEEMDVLPDNYTLVGPGG